MCKGRDMGCLPVQAEGGWRSNQREPHTAHSKQAAKRAGTHPAVPLMLMDSRHWKGCRYKIPSLGCTPASTLQGRNGQDGGKGSQSDGGQRAGVEWCKVACLPALRGSQLDGEAVCRCRVV